MNISISTLERGFLLVLNLGSSSLKFSLVDSISLEKECVGSMTGMYGKETVMEITGMADGVQLDTRFQGADLATCMDELMGWLKTSRYSSKMVAVGYRVVQGGPDHLGPEVVSAVMLEDLRAYSYLAPNHLPGEIALMETFGKEFPAVPHIACFDTFFHRDLPPVAKFYPLPHRFREMGLQRYGFHGLSCESVFQQLLEEDVDVAHERIIIAHLGSGSSMTAVGRGSSWDTTMGISPMGGLVMATRAGDLDPGAILFMLGQGELSIAQLDQVLSNEAGLKAMAGTGDMREILAGRDHGSIEALELFCYQAKKHLGSLAAVLGGLDLLVFCGGIGENASLIRDKICTDMEFMGISLDPLSNAENETTISRWDSKVQVRVMKTDEQHCIAMHIQQLLGR